MPLIIINYFSLRGIQLSHTLHEAPPMALSRLEDLLASLDSNPSIDIEIRVRPVRRVQA